jgi:hypothetical protein
MNDDIPAIPHALLSAEDERESGTLYAWQIDTAEIVRPILTFDDHDVP